MSSLLISTQQEVDFTEQEARPLWTVGEVAVYLRLNPETVRQMARKASIPAIKMGRGWRFRSNDIKAWLLAKEK